MINKDIFEACQKCYAVGIANPLYLSSGIVSCPIHGEVDNQSMAAYRKAGSLFLLSTEPERTQSALNNGDNT